jgi:hypothetical protein
MEGIAMKTLTAAVLVVTLLTFTGCGKQGSSPTAPKPPSVGLIEAAATGNLEAIQQHIKAGSDLNEKEPSRGSSPLITATVFGQTGVAKALIEAGADLDYKNNDGSTPLITAAFFCRTEIVKTLLENGADKDVRNNAGRTALDAVAGPFVDMKPTYDQLRAALGPLGIELDYERIKMTRPKIAEMLRQE